MILSSKVGQCRACRVCGVCWWLEPYRVQDLDHQHLLVRSDWLIYSGSARGWPCQLLPCLLTYLQTACIPCVLSAPAPSGYFVLCPCTTIVPHVPLTACWIVKLPLRPTFAKHYMPLCKPYIGQWYLRGQESYMHRQPYVCMCHGMCIVSLLSLDKLP